MHIPSSTPSTQHSSAVLHHMKTEKILQQTSAVDLLAIIDSLRGMKLVGAKHDEAQRVLSDNHPNLILPKSALQDPLTSSAYKKSLEVGQMLKRRLQLEEQPYLLVNGRVRSLIISLAGSSLKSFAAYWAYSRLCIRNRGLPCAC